MRVYTEEKERGDNTSAESETPKKIDKEERGKDKTKKGKAGRRVSIHAVSKFNADTERGSDYHGNAQCCESNPEDEARACARKREGEGGREEERGREENHGGAPAITRKRTRAEISETPSTGTRKGPSQVICGCGFVVTVLRVAIVGGQGGWGRRGAGGGGGREGGGERPGTTHGKYDGWWEGATRIKGW